MTDISPLPDCPIAPVRVPARHGGRRPGAGAPFGNINAMRNGATSARYSLASLLVRAMAPYWRDGWNLPNSPAERRRRFHHLLDAAAWTIRSYPEMPSQLEENMRAYLGPGPGGYRIPRERDILRWLDNPRLRTHERRTRDFLLLGYVFEHQPGLAAILVEDFILDRFNAGLEATASNHPPLPTKNAKNSIEQPNDQASA